MSQVQVFFRHRRTLLTRLAALLVLGFGGLLIVLPRADAHGVTQAVSNQPAGRSLLSPDRLAGPRFSTFYGRPAVTAVDF